ncbi:hypothetical protein PAEPH01_2181 [Pancytospora epiphaga]|nr:hypothetical protein PAEPH01_2181 [Pancytospora epiphaga]
MLQDASYLADRSYMSLEALIDRIILRSPSEVSTVLLLSYTNIHSIHDIFKFIDKVHPFTFNTVSPSPHTPAPVAEPHSHASYTSLLLHKRQKVRFQNRTRAQPGSHRSHSHSSMEHQQQPYNRIKNASNILRQYIIQVNVKLTVL